MLLPLHRAIGIFGPLAAVLVLSVPTIAAAEATPASLDSSESDAPPAEWGISGAIPQTGSTPHTSGRAFASEPKVRVVIDKTAQEMTVLIDEVESYVWNVSTGLPGYDTPSGTYRASSMNEIWYSKEWDNAPMPHAIFFTKRGHAIHGTDETKKLGMPASHGCVRLSPENARTLFLVVEESGLENTEIVLNGNIPRAKTRVASPEPRKQYIKSKKKSSKTAVKKAKPSAKKVATPSAAKAEAARPGAPKRQVKVPEALVEGIEKPRRLRRKERRRLYYSERARMLTPPRYQEAPPGARAYWRR